MKEQEDLGLFDTIIYYLDNDGFEYEVLEHEFIHSAEEASKVRGTKLSESVKALVFEGTRSDDSKECVMALVSGDKKVNSNLLKQIAGFVKVKLASPEQVQEITGLTIGKIPPLPFMFSLRGFFDEAILDEEKIAFSAASHYKSIKMRPDDLLLISGAQKSSISKE